MPAHEPRAAALFCSDFVFRNLYFLLRQDDLWSLIACCRAIHAYFSDEFCATLTSLHGSTSRTKLNATMTSTMLRRSSRLVTLDLTLCQGVGRQGLARLLALVGPQLRVLLLCPNQNVCLEVMSAFCRSRDRAALEVLDVSGSRGFCKASLEEVLRHCPSLRRLGVAYCRKDVADCAYLWRQVAGRDNFRKLRSLDVSGAEKFPVSAATLIRGSPLEAYATAGCAADVPYRFLRDLAGEGEPAFHNSVRSLNIECERRMRGSRSRYEAETLHLRTKAGVDVALGSVVHLNVAGQRLERAFCAALSLSYGARPALRQLRSLSLARCALDDERCRLLARGLRARLQALDLTSCHEVTGAGVGAFIEAADGGPCQLRALVCQDMPRVESLGPFPGEGAAPHLLYLNFQRSGVRAFDVFDFVRVHAPNLIELCCPPNDDHRHWNLAGEVPWVRYINGARKRPKSRPLPRGACTILETGFKADKRRGAQLFWHCATCHMEGGLGICGHCAALCHEGHDVYEGSYMPSYCDCAVACSCRALPMR